MRLAQNRRRYSTDCKMRRYDEINCKRPAVCERMNKKYTTMEINSFASLIFRMNRSKTHTATTQIAYLHIHTFTHTHIRAQNYEQSAIRTHNCIQYKQTYTTPRFWMRLSNPTSNTQVPLYDIWLLYCSQCRCCCCFGCCCCCCLLGEAVLVLELRRICIYVFAMFTSQNIDTQFKWNSDIHEVCQPEDESHFKWNITTEIGPSENRTHSDWKWYLIMCIAHWNRTKVDRCDAVIYMRV